MRRIKLYFDVARAVAAASKDRSTQVGAVVIGPYGEYRSVGYNGFVRGAPDDDPKLHERPQKYRFTAHAEENCVSNAALVGASLQGCVCYCTLPPCSTCTRLLVQSGVRKIRCLCPGTEEAIEAWLLRWGEDFVYSVQIASQGGVGLELYSGVWAENEEGKVYDSRDDTVQEVAKRLGLPVL